MHQPRRARDHLAEPGGAQIVGLQLDGGEAAGAVRQRGHAAVAAGGVQQGDDRGGVQETVGRHVLGFDGEMAPRGALGHLVPDQPQLSGQHPLLALEEAVGLAHAGHPASSPFRPATKARGWSIIR